LDNEEYARMTKSITKHENESFINGTINVKELSDLNRQVTAILNMFFSVGAVFFAAYYFGGGISSDPGLVSEKIYIYIFFL